jgi:GntR family transcriptional regulator/MocR family aminotransferase
VPRTIDLRRGELSFEVVRSLLGTRLGDDLADLVRRGFNYCDAMGSPALRTIFVSQLAQIATRIEDTIVTHGALGALDLALRAYRPRRFVAFDPTYREALAIAATHGVPAVPMMRPVFSRTSAELAAHLRPEDMVYIVPTLNNPDGQSLRPVEAQLLAYAIARSGATLIEDDAYGLLVPAAARSSVSARAIEINPTAQVLRLQSFSKIVCPGARCCIVEGSPHAVKRLANAKVDFGTAPLASEFVAKILSDDFGTFCAAVADELRERCALACEALGDWAGRRDPDGGYYVWLPWSSYTTDSAALTADIARSTGVLVGDGQPFRITQSDARAHVRVSVAWATRADLAAGCRALRRHRSLS